MAELSKKPSNEAIKRMRKGTHSCAECRRRKKSCIPHSSGKCTECNGRGVDCVEQETRQTKRPRVDSKRELQDRVMRLERTVQNLAERSGEEPLDYQSLATSQPASYQESNLSSSDSDETLPHAESIASAPVFSLFDNAILSRQDDDSTLQAFKASKTTARRDQKLGNMRRQLLATFPPAALEEQIMKCSYWWDPWKDMFPKIFGPDGTSFRDYIVGAKASDNVQRVAKALLSLTLTIQEARGSGDDLTKYAPESGMWSGLDSDPPFSQDIARCFKLVDDLISTDDEMASTIDGIDCLVLQGQHESNDGRLRRSWIYYRKAAIFGQLIGLHRRTNVQSAEAERRAGTWNNLFEGDRFMSLLLGLPYCVANVHLKSDRIEGATDYFVRLATIAGDVIDRNLENSIDSGYTSTIQAEGQLGQLAQMMPSAWWQCDYSSPEEVGKSLYRRLLPQFWHHQVRVFLHLPFMLKANQERQFEFNKIAALDSARGMITRYHIIRPVQGFQSLVCKIIDFQVLIAAMLLILNRLGSTTASGPKNSETEDARDYELLTSTSETLRVASKTTGGNIASQAARTISMFTKIRTLENLEACDSTKVVIPYFGTVAFGRGKEFAKRGASGPSASNKNAETSTTAESQTGSISDSAAAALDPFISIDSYMAHNLDLLGPPFDQLSTGFGPYNLDLTNVNLDLDQEWTWSTG